MPVARRLQRSEGILDGASASLANLAGTVPNPFNPTATISFGVRETQFVRVAMFDALRRQVKSLFEGNVAGDEVRSSRIESGDLSSGLYLIQIQGDLFVASRAAALSK